MNRDVFLMDGHWLQEYEEAHVDMFNGASYRAVGCISYASIRSIGADALELYWYPNISDRYHEVWIRLRRDAFITCVDTPAGTSIVTYL